MSKVIKRGNREVISLSVLNRTFYLSLFFVNAVIVKEFNGYESFDKLDSIKQAEVKQYIRDLVIKEEDLSTQKIEEKILTSFLSKKLQKELLKLIGA